jgi:hypothetical protein
MPDSTSPSVTAPRAPARLARGLGWVGVALGVLPWLLIVPLAIYQMDFMLYTWIWPAVLGAAGTGAGLLALRLRDPHARLVALAAIALGVLALVSALAGFGWMLAGMGM